MLVEGISGDFDYYYLNNSFDRKTLYTICKNTESLSPDTSGNENSLLPEKQHCFENSRDSENVSSIATLSWYVTKTALMLKKWHVIDSVCHPQMFKRQLKVCCCSENDETSHVMEMSYPSTVSLFSVCSSVSSIRFSVSSSKTPSSSGSQSFNWPWEQTKTEVLQYSDYSKVLPQTSLLSHHTFSCGCWCTHQAFLTSLTRSTRLIKLLKQHAKTRADLLKPELL